jgi:hypothetical protein
MPSSRSIALPGLGDARSGKTIGTIYDDAPMIVIHGDVLDELVCDYSARDLRRERGAFLLGMQYDSPRPLIEIRHYLPAAETKNLAASITFTHDTWSALTREAATQFPDDIVLGWHHTHPGFGIFLSPYDMFIHRHFFSEPWQVALVVDPRRCEFGFFQWRGGEIVDCGFVCINEDRA